jgi:hypothetical protein
MKLRLADLAIESFDTSGAAMEEGTVIGHSGETNDEWSCRCSNFCQANTLSDCYCAGTASQGCAGSGFYTGCTCYKDYTCYGREGCDGAGGGGGDTYGDGCYQEPV